MGKGREELKVQIVNGFSLPNTYSMELDAGTGLPYPRSDELEYETF